jgi:APA family basic amino acid/polyamine antiporter
MTQPVTQQLDRVLSFKNLFFIAVGQIIGGGVIALTGVAIGMTGPGVVAAYAAASVLVLLASVLIMVAGATVPATGAFYVWPARLLNGWFGCITLFLILLASITLSLYGSAFGLYMAPLFPEVPEHYWGIGVITALVFANLFGLQLAASVQTALVLILLSALAIFAGFAMPKIQVENLSPMLPNGILGFATAVFLVKFATGGATNIVGLGGEMLNPARDIPRVIISATLAVAVVYCFVALASVGVVPWQTMINQPLTVAGEAFLPGWALLYFLAGGAGLAVLTTLNAQLIQIPRNFLVASWDHLLPPWFGNLNRFDTGDRFQTGHRFDTGHHLQTG